MKDRLRFGQLEVRKVYNSDEYEIAIQSGWRGGIRRLCLCHHEQDAIDIKKAVEYALENKVIS